MSEVASIIADLITAGVDPVLVGRVAAALTEAAKPSLPAKSSAAVRQQRYRDGLASLNVTNRNDVTDDHGVTNRNEFVTDRNSVTPLARGEDNPLRLVTTGDNTTLNAQARDFRSKPDLDWLSGRLREAGGLALASMAIAPGMADLSPIIGLLKAGAGPPCDLEADVFPVITARCVRQKPGSVKSWTFFRDAALEARDRRLAGAPAVDQTQTPRGQGPPQSLTERIAAEHAEARTLAFQMMDAQNGRP